MMTVHAVAQMIMGLYERGFGDPRVPRKLPMSVTAESLR
jgi:hypothetical protein